MENATPYTTSRQHGDHRSICEIKYRKAWCTLGTRRRRCCGTGQEPDNERKTANPFLRQPVGEVSFRISYDADVFEAPTVALKDGLEGTLTSTEADGKILYTLKNEAGILASTSDFATITMKAKADAQPGSYA